MIGTKMKKEALIPLIMLICACLVLFFITLHGILNPKQDSKKYSSMLVWPKKETFVVKEYLGPIDSFNNLKAIIIKSNKTNMESFALVNSAREIVVGEEVEVTIITLITFYEKYDVFCCI